MNSRDFISKLESSLRGLAEKDKNEVLFYYEELIFGMIEEGYSEEDAIRSLGSINEIIEKILENHNISLIVEPHKESVEPVYFPKNFGRKTQNINISKITKLAIKSAYSDIRFFKHYEDEIKIRSFNSLFSKINLSNKNDTLYISRSAKPHLTYLLDIPLMLLGIFIVVFLLGDSLNFWWSALIGFGIGCSVASLNRLFFITSNFFKTYIYLPENKNYNINIDSRAGSFKFNQLALGNIYASVKSGSIKFIDSNAGSVYLKATAGSLKFINNDLEAPRKVSDITAVATAGSIKISNLICDSLSARTKSGSIKLKKLFCQNKIEAFATSGSVKGLEVKAEEITSKAKSGSVKFRDSVINDSIDLAVTSGSVKVKSTCFKNAVAVANSGSVKFLQLNDSRKNYDLDLKSLSGSVKIKEVAGNHFNEVKEAADAKKSIKARARSGSVKVTFLI